MRTTTATAPKLVKFALRARPQMRPLRKERQMAKMVAVSGLRVLDEHDTPLPRGRSFPNAPWLLSSSQLLRRVDSARCCYNQFART